MKRKLVKQGSSTMMVSLPSKWIKENKLDKGSEVDIQEKGNSITIGTKIKDKKEITIKITDENKNDIKNILTHVYRRGFDKIVLKGKHKEVAKEIRPIVNDLLLGFEITELSSDKASIENISEPTEQRYDLILSKIFKIIEETQDFVLNDFEKNKFEDFQDIEDLRKQHDRFVLFCRRLLIRENTGKEQIIHWELLTFLMHIEHIYYYLYEYASKNKISKNNEVINLLKHLKEYFKLYKEAYYNQNMNGIHKINHLKKEYYLGKTINLLEKSKSKDTVILAYIREIYRLIQIGSSPIINDIIENQSTFEW